MRVRDCVWPQPSEADSGPSIQLTGKLAGHWVNPVAQEQVRHGRGHNPNSPQKDATPARCASAESGLNRNAESMADFAKADRKSTRLNSSHRCISYAVFCLKKKIIKEKKMR